MPRPPVVVPAQPGFFVLHILVEDDTNHVISRTEVIAWDLSWPNSDNMPPGPRPITLDPGHAGRFVLSPGLRVTDTGSEQSWDTEQQWVDYILGVRRKMRGKTR